MSKNGDDVDWVTVKLTGIINPRLFGKPEARFSFNTVSGRAATMRLTFDKMARLLGHDSAASAENWLNLCASAQKDGRESPPPPSCDLSQTAMKEITSGLRGMLAVTRLDCI